MQTSDLAIVRSAIIPAAVLPTAVRADDVDPDDDRDDTDGMPTMTVEFSRFGTWYPIRSYWEGEYLERTAKGAFKKTIAERGSAVRVLFNHGFDFHIGDKILGVPELLEERDTSPYGEVPLLDTSYNHDLVAGLRAGGYGSSFMFNVIRDEWFDPEEPSEHNPRALPERTILEVRLLEFGPVTWPANPDATAGLRCGTDHYADKLRARSPERFQAFTERFTDFRAQRGLRTPDSGAACTSTPDDGAAGISTDAPDTTPVAVHPSGLREARERVLVFPFLTR